MPIPLQTPIVRHVGNGVTTVFAYPFGVLVAADLKVRVAGVDITSGYTVSGVGNRAGGTVTFAAAPANGAEVLLFREVTLERQTDYQYAGDLRESVLDDDFDRTMMALQDTQARFQRSITIPAGETFTSLPAASARANRVMGFGPDGEVVLISAFGGGGGAIDIVPADGSVTTQKLANDAVTADKAVATLVEDLLGFTPADESQVAADLGTKANVSGSASQAFDVAAATTANQATNYGQVFGLGQSWQNVTGSRAFNVNYPNSTGKPIIVAFYFPSTGSGTVSLVIDGVNLGAIAFGKADGPVASGQILIPAGSTYQLQRSGSLDLNNWIEYR